jgi:hypothetical protein
VIAFRWTSFRPSVSLAARKRAETPGSGLLPDRVWAVTTRVVQTRTNGPKRGWLLLWFLLSWPALAQTPGTFVGRNTDPNAPPLSAAALNAALGTKADAANGVLTNPTITGGTMSGNASLAPVTSSATGTTKTLSNWVDQGVTPLLSKPAYNADLLSLRGQAPRRNLMNLSIGPLTPVKQTFSAGTLYTFQEITPIEGMAYAVRITVPALYNGLSQIASASVYFSDSYSGAVQNGVQNFTGNTTTIPTTNSTYQSCTTTSGSATVVCSNTALLPSAATMYVIGPGMPINGTATVASGTNITLSANATASATITLQFANIAPECKMYWDNQGADVDTINTAGVARSFSFTGPAANTGAGPYPISLQSSDFVACTSLPRADGGIPPLAFIYFTLGTTSTVYGQGPPHMQTYNANVAPLLGNRYIFMGHAWNNGGADYADNPSGSGFTATPIAPLIELSYLTDTKGWNILQVGDSISTSPPDDSFSTPIYRACKLLSTPQAPCEWSSVAWGGTASPIYDESLRNNIQILQPSAIVGQPISRNDGATLAAYQMLMAKFLSYTATADARLGLYGLFPFTTTADSSAQVQADDATMRARLLAISKTCQPNTGGQTCPMIPVLDGAKYLSREVLGGNAWDYLGMGATASGAVAPGVTAIPITAQSGAPCYAGDLLTDVTTPAAILAGATIVSSTTSSLTVASTAVVGGGILIGDALVCSMPGWTGGALTYDNTHPWNPAMLLLQPPANTFVNQLLGLQ